MLECRQADALDARSHPVRHYITCHHRHYSLPLWDIHEIRALRLYRATSEDSHTCTDMKKNDFFPFHPITLTVFQRSRNRESQCLSGVRERGHQVVA